MTFEEAVVHFRKRSPMGGPWTVRDNRAALVLIEQLYKLRSIEKRVAALEAIAHS